jgi:hypothetical protein
MSAARAGTLLKAKTATATNVATKVFNWRMILKESKDLLS